MLSVFGVGGDEVLVPRQELGLRQEPDIGAVATDHWHVEIAGAFELLKNQGGAVVFVNELFRLDHEVLDDDEVVELRLEDDVAVVVHDQEAHEVVLIVGDHKEVAFALGDALRVLAQFAVCRHGADVVVDDVVPLEFAKGELVLVVGHEVVLLGQRLRVDGVFLEGVDAEVGAGGSDHQRNEQGVAGGKLRDEKHGGHGGLHHACHDTGHAREDEIHVGQVQSQQVVGQPRHKEACEGTDEQGGGEDTSDAARRRGERGGEHFHQDDARQCQKHNHLAGEQAVQWRADKEARIVAVQQGVDIVVTFAIENREDVDKTAEHETSHNRAHAEVLDTLHLSLNPTRHPKEIDGDEACEKAEEDIEGDVAEVERLGGVDMEHHVVAQKEQGHDGAGGGGEQQGQDGAAGEVEHEDLESEDDGSDGGLEDGGHGRCGAAGQQQSGLPGVKPEKTGHVGADGGTRQHNGGLQSHGAAEADGDGAGHHGGIDVVEAQLAVAFADGLEHDADAVAEVIAHHTAHEQQSEQDAHNGQDEVEVVNLCVGEGAP